MKNKITIAALMLAAFLCTSANASTVLLSFSGSTYTAIYNGVSYNITATAVDCPSASSCSGTGATTPGVTDTSHGLGITGNPNTEIADYDYIVLDFSSLKTAIGTSATPGVSIGLWETIAGNSSANIIGTNSNPLGSTNQDTNQIGTNAGVTKTVSLNNGTNGVSLGNYTITDTTSGIYQYYIVDVTTNGGGCGVLISGTAVPEPATFVLAGMALLGLGMTMKRRGNRKV